MPEAEPEAELEAESEAEQVDGNDSAKDARKESRDRIERAGKSVFEIFIGRPKEELCAALCAIAAGDGFYEEAIRFAELAISHRDSIVRPGPMSRRDDLLRRSRKSDGR